VPPVISMSILFFISQNLWTEWVEEVFITNQEVDNLSVIDKLLDFEFLILLFLVKFYYFLINWKLV